MQGPGTFRNKKHHRFNDLPKVLAGCADADDPVFACSSGTSPAVTAVARRSAMWLPDSSVVRCAGTVVSWHQAYDFSAITAVGFYWIQTFWPLMMPVAIGICGGGN
jgi:hypothetical protein